MYLLKMLPAPVDLLKITSGEWQRSKMSNKHLIGVCQIYLLSPLFAKFANLAALSCKRGKLVASSCTLLIAALAGARHERVKNRQNTQTAPC